ncbi:MAG: hypothetical protein U0326_29365 [Polyangiales bacterium]
MRGGISDALLMAATLLVGACGGTNVGPTGPGDATVSTDVLPRTDALPMSDRADVNVMDTPTIEDAPRPADGPTPGDTLTPTDDGPSDAEVATACSRPGVIERVGCGLCGTLERFCNATRMWEYGACSGEGVCTPGTTTPQACGRCGTRQARCSDRCVLDTSAPCMGEGDCAPGETRRTSAGCPLGQTRLLRCSAACALVEEAEPCASQRLVDVMILLDATSSFSGYLGRGLPHIRTRLVAPLLAMPEAYVGVSSFDEFPVRPYSMDPLDTPFLGGVEPTTSADSIGLALSTRVALTGGDGPEATVEALSVLAGRPIHPTVTTPLTCSSGREPGGCWRLGARRIIVVFTDASMHNAPITGGSIPYPYTGITPPAATWLQVSSAFRDSGTMLLVILPGADPTADEQFRRMLSDLGQPTTDIFRPTEFTYAETVDAVFSRITAIRGP